MPLREVKGAVSAGVMDCIVNERLGPCCAVCPDISCLLQSEDTIYISGNTAFIVKGITWDCTSLLKLGDYHMKGFSF